jgi:hypothetical protein
MAEKWATSERNADRLRYWNKINHYTHGMSGTPIYAIWWSMIQRCKDPNHAAFKNYGGRGKKRKKLKG